jgi:glycosyltransferase involved in cell wall biosynthesis
MMNFTPLTFDVPSTTEPPIEFPACRESEPRSRTLDPAFLRHSAWEVGATRAAEAYAPTENHVALGMVSPCQGFAHWRIRHEWIEQTRQQRGEAWQHCRMVLRLYDVSYLEFTGLNAHALQDQPLPGIAGQLFFKLPRPGTWQIGEVGFLLRSGEFIPAARSRSVPFAQEAASKRGDQAGLLVTPRFRLEEIANVWEQERILRERARPRLRQPLRLAFFAHTLAPDDLSARFVQGLAAGQGRLGHDVHLFAPAGSNFDTPHEAEGIHYQPLAVGGANSPVDWARAYAGAAERRLGELPPFDIHHLQEWLTGPSDRPFILALSSIEATRRHGAAPTPLSLRVEAAERTLARAAECVLTGEAMRTPALTHLGLDAGRMHAFPMEGRLPNEWTAPLDLGQVKMGVGLGPLDRMVVFVGPLEHAAGVDLLVDSLPVMLQRLGNFRVVLVGGGPMHAPLEHRAHHLGVAHAVRLLGHVEGAHLTRLLRAAEALVLPSRYRVPQDDAVVELARRAGRPVVTTHGGPAHLVRHEENGVVTYDNPGSIVWALDRILGDPAHAAWMGRNGRPGDSGIIDWAEVARRYSEICARTFPALAERLLD